MAHNSKHFTKLFQDELLTVHDDERPIRQLRRTKNDRRSRRIAAQDPHAQDPPAHSLVAQVHLRQAHSRQAREVLAQEQRVQRDSIGGLGARTHDDLIIVVPTPIAVVSRAFEPRTEPRQLVGRFVLIKLVDQH